MTLGAAFLSYGIKLVLFSVVAILGVTLGIKLRKRKNSKNAVDRE